eukprot:6212362-Pleurochrysis_carterae.AAC.12
MMRSWARPRTHQKLPGRAQASNAQEITTNAARPGLPGNNGFTVSASTNFQSTPQLRRRMRALVISWARRTVFRPRSLERLSATSLPAPFEVARDLARLAQRHMLSVTYKLAYKLEYKALSVTYLSRCRVTDKKGLKASFNISISLSHTYEQVLHAVA